MEKSNSAFVFPIKAYFNPVPHRNSIITTSTKGIIKCLLHVGSQLICLHHETANMDAPVEGDYQFEEVDEFVGVFSSGEVHKVSGDSVTQAGAGLNRHLAGGVAERRTFLLINTT